MIWKLIKDPITGQENVVWRELENGSQESCLITVIKKEILADEAQLQDADGNTMTPEQAKAYVESLP